MRRNSTAVSDALFERARKVMPGGNTRTTIFLKPHPPYAAKGAGCRVFDVDGAERIDFTNNFFSLIHGHVFRPIIDAVKAQLELGSSFGLPTESEVALAEEICGRNPAFEQIRFSNSGTEAVLSLVKAARAFTGRAKIAKIEGSYHGAYDHVEVSLDSSPKNWGGATPERVPYVKGTPPSVLADTIVIPFNDVAAAKRLIAKHASELACVLVDLMPSRVGMVPASLDFITTLREETRRYKVLLGIDEVITFRLAPGGLQSAYGVAADLTALAKIIGGGFPVGAVVGRKDVMAVFDPTAGKPPVPHGGTLTANPITMTAGLVAMQHLTKDAYARLDKLGERARSGLEQVLKQAGVPGQVCGLGSLFRLHLTAEPITDYRSGYADAPKLAALGVLHRHLLDNGVLVTPQLSGALSTPMAEQEVDRLVELVAEGLPLAKPHLQASAAE
jgi:glutamate-1-semialdehyde 2,1-aminomutase